MLKHGSGAIDAALLVECAVALYWAAFMDLLAEVRWIEDGKEKLYLIRRMML
jgi:hypothetical protein